MSDSVSTNPEFIAACSAVKKIVADLPFPVGLVVLRSVLRTIDPPPKQADEQTLTEMAKDIIAENTLKLNLPDAINLFWQVAYTATAIAAAEGNIKHFHQAMLDAINLMVIASCVWKLQNPLGPSNWQM